jgi:hypothetical protein
MDAPFENAVEMNKKTKEGRCAYSRLPGKWAENQ